MGVEKHLFKVWFYPTNVYSFVDNASLDSYSAVVIDICYCIWSHFGCSHLTSSLIFVAHDVYSIANGVFMSNALTVFSFVVKHYLCLFLGMHRMPINDSCHIKYHVSSKDYLSRRRL